MLGPKHDPVKVAERVANGKDVSDASVNVHSAKAANHLQIMQTEVGKLYLMIGRELEELQEVPAGNVVGIGGLQGSVRQSRLLSKFAFQRCILPQLLNTQKNVTFHLNLHFNLQF